MHVLARSLLNIVAHVRISFAHTYPARSLPCNRSQLALSSCCLPSASTIRSTALRNTCIYAQVRFSWRFGLAPFIAYSGTHTSHTRCHTCYLCIRICPFCSYSALIHYSLAFGHYLPACSLLSICQRSFRFGTRSRLSLAHFLSIAPMCSPALRCSLADTAPATAYICGYVVTAAGSQPATAFACVICPRFRLFLLLHLQCNCSKPHLSWLRL